MSFPDMNAGPPDPYSTDVGGFEGSQTDRDRPPRPREHSRSRSKSPHDRPPPASKRTGGPTSDVPASTVLGVFGLSIRTQERDLEDEFNRFGKVDRVTIVYDQRSDRSRGFGFIKMATLEDASRCIQELNGLDLHGRRIRVDYSMTEKPHQPTPGQYMGHRSSRNDDRDRDRYRPGRSDRDRYDRDGGRDRDRDRDRDRHDGRDRDVRYDRDRDRDRERDRDRDRDRYRDKPRDRDSHGRDRDAYGRDRDRRSPTRRRSPERPERRKRSYSRSPPRGGHSSPARKDYGATTPPLNGSANGNHNDAAGVKW